MGELAPELAVGGTIDVAFRVERDDWNGQRRVQANLAGIRR
jgi:hypothetical protein